MKILYRHFKKRNDKTNQDHFCNLKTIKKQNQESHDLWPCSVTWKTFSICNISKDIRTLSETLDLPFIFNGILPSGITFNKIVEKT